MESIAFMVLTLGCLGLAIPTGNRAMLRTVLTILGCWALGMLWRNTVVPSSDWPWLFYAVTDSIAAMIILRSPAGKWQGFIGLCFLVQIATNVGYGWAFLERGYNFDAAMLAWNINYWLGLVKLALLGVWGGTSIIALGGFRRSWLHHYLPRHQGSRGGQ